MVFSHLLFSTCRPSHHSIEDARHVLRWWTQTCYRCQKSRTSPGLWRGGYSSYGTYQKSITISIKPMHITQFVGESWRRPSLTSPIPSRCTTFFFERLLHRLVDNTCERQLRTYGTLASTLHFYWELQKSSMIRGTTPSPNRVLGDE